MSYLSDQLLSSFPGRVPGHLKYLSPFPVCPVKTARCKHCLMMSDSDFHCFCLPGGAAERPLPSGSGIKELRPLPSGHAPPEPNKCLCDRLVLPLCPVIVSGSECFIYSFVFFIPKPVHLVAVPESLGAVRDQSEVTEQRSSSSNRKMCKNLKQKFKYETFRVFGADFKIF